MKDALSLKQNCFVLILLFLFCAFLKVNAQVWVPVSDYSTINGSDSYLIVDVLSGNALACDRSALEKEVEAVKLDLQDDGSIADNTQIQNNLKWIFRTSEDGCYKVRSLEGSRYVLYRDGSVLRTGQNRTVNSDWQIDYKSDIYNGFRESQSGRVICMSNSSWKAYDNTPYYIETYKTHLVVYELSAVNPPVMSFLSGTYYKPFDVTISAQEGYTIHYTIDGTEPTSESPVYTEPIHVTGSLTLKAIAVNGSLISRVSEVQYTFGKTVGNIAEFKQLSIGEEACLTLNDAIVIGLDNDNYYIQDATGGLCVNRSENQYAINDILNGTIIGSYNKNGGTPQMTDADYQVEVTAGGTLQPVDLTIDDLTADAEKYVCMLIKVSNVSYDGKQYLTSKETDNKISFYDKFNAVGQEVWPSLVDVTGIVLLDGDTPQLAIRSWADVADATNLSIPDFYWSEPSCTADFAIPEVAEFPTLINTSDGLVTYTSSDPNVATISSTGEIKLTGTGMTVITAQVSETNHYALATTSFELTVISSLSSSQAVAFVCTIDGQSFALSNINSSSGKLKAIPVKMLNGKVVGVSNIDAISWFVDGEESAITSSNGQYLSYASTTNLILSDEPYTWICNKDEQYWSPSESGTRAITYTNTSSNPDGYFGAYNVNGYPARTVARPLVSGYTRTISSGKFGTICLPCNVESGDFSGAVFYEIVGKKVDENRMPTHLVLTPVTRLEAGKPYLFQADDDEMILAYSGASVPVAAENNGLIGSFDGIKPDASAELSGKYLLSNNKIVKCGTGCTLGSNRAYIDMDKVPVIDGSDGYVNTLAIQIAKPTSVDNISVVDSTRVDVYNLSGEKICNQVDINTISRQLPAGIYVINGKKVIF